jgi:deazaflavin-dependent oxidoreductase (nitroreductase family)
MDRVLVVAGGVILAFAGIVIAFVVGMRHKAAPVLDLVRKLSRKMKPLVLRTAGSKGAHTSIVRHVGRNSGQIYETPVVAAPVDDGFVIALPYGPDTDWLKNLFAAGRAEVVFDGGTHEVEGPERIAIEEATAHFAAREQRLHKQFRVRDGVRVRSARVTAGRATAA